eukprot:TRINITY_DN6326_c0_g1_i7.p2 TRINITY_DN6326_c0_g1~~TRINITY_DN6326_c0_g1_i7.p2  ORF type:complete len:252 (-),score=50.32 TRINITY_DN6326_c0_g1_i7:219-974(-)
MDADSVLQSLGGVFQGGAQQFRSFSKTFREKHQRPFVTLTYAQSIDGSITGAKGTQVRLSCHESMVMTHALRSCHSGIMIGKNTMLTDNPSLNVRYVLGPSPQPIIIDSRLETPTTAKLFSDPNCIKPVIFCSSIEQSEEVLERGDQLKLSGATILCLEQDCSRIDLRKLLYSIPESITSVMIEGGAAVIQEMLSGHIDLVDQMVVTISPQLLGGVKAINSPLSSPLNLQRASWRQFGCDIVLCATTNPGM